MEKKEYDQLIKEQYIARIAFNAEKYPYIAPFLYVFDGNFLYFLSTRYGKEDRLFQENPYVTVEIERYDPINPITLLFLYQDTSSKSAMK